MKHNLISDLINIVVPPGETPEYVVNYILVKFVKLNCCQHIVPLDFAKLNFYQHILPLETKLNVHEIFKRGLMCKWNI